jgi:uncharacterized protein (DUF697 family)
VDAGFVHRGVFLFPERKEDTVLHTYEDQIRRELRLWKRDLLKPPGLIERAAKGMQTKVNELLPEKVHQTMTAVIKGIVRTTLSGLEYVPAGKPLRELTLYERDERAKQLLATYKKIAAAEGAGTGAGGILLGMMDFPALIAIKMKFLFELAHVYGYDTHDARERLYLLHVFQLAFSSQTVRPALFARLENWEQTHGTRVRSADGFADQIDWEQFQREYRDAIDFRKMLQLIPGLGAVIGAWANYGLLDDLGRTGINCFRMRLLGQAD